MVKNSDEPEVKPIYVGEPASSYVHIIGSATSALVASASSAVFVGATIGGPVGVILGGFIAVAGSTAGIVGAIRAGQKEKSQND